jgi:tRNA nucleotidyltransferase/poly(A) polymerase
MTEFFQVGGSVRDELMGLKSKDIDFTVVAPSYQAMKDAIESRGYEIFMENPEFFTIRGRGLLGACDFVWSRTEGPYSDGRHPDWVEPASLKYDLARRDFKMNAIAKAESGELIDPFGGIQDIRERIISCVGNPKDRFAEDELRAIRAIRFAITKDMRLHASLIHPIETTDFTHVSTERIFEEFHKMFRHSTWRTLDMINTYPNLEGLFEHRLNLEPTLKGVK